MKNFLYIVALLSASTSYSSQKIYSPCAVAFSSGYVFKNSDCIFKEVYGRGITNIITGDVCYYPGRFFGIGSKVSYWRATGKTTFLKRDSTVQEVPLTFYARLRKPFNCGLQLYSSLGGGAVFIHEKSYLGSVQKNRGIGEVEAGMLCPLWRCVDLTTAFRYLFPSQQSDSTKVTIGGFDLRAGIAFEF